MASPEALNPAPFNRCPRLPCSRRLTTTRRRKRYPLSENDEDDEEDEDGDGDGHNEDDRNVDAYDGAGGDDHDA